jgi:UDP-N-acetylmuramoyl-tripeptide--D-alanyl-D-alanine ligase
MKTLLFIVLAPLALVRWSRWLAIVQQKEYRPDRLIAYLKSAEGWGEFWRIIPQKKDLTRSGLKRPRLTARIKSVLVMSLLLIVYLAWRAAVAEPLLALIIGAISYLLLPVLVSVAAIPTSFISELVTRSALRRAKRLVDQFNPRIIGITGSYGKTSTKLLLAHVLGQRYKVFTTPKSFNQRYSIAQSVLHDYQGQGLMVLEYAAYRIGEIKELTQYFKPSMAIVTGLTNQHLSTFGSLENVIKAKSELVTSVGNRGVIFYNGQDDGVFKIIEAGGATEPIDYTKVDNLKAYLSGEGKLTLEWKNHKLHTQLAGMHYLEAVQAAIACSLYLGVSEREIVSGLTSFQPGENFVRTARLKGGAMLLDDGRTANQAGFKAAVDLLRTLRTTNRHPKALLIFAGIIDLGEETSQTHLGLANYAKDVVDEVLYVGSDGLKEFQGVFGQRLIIDEAEINNRLKNMGQDTIVLLEGYIPKKHEAYLQ